MVESNKKRNEECVRVIVRCRPMAEKEKKAGHKKVIEIDQKVCQVSIFNTKTHKADDQHSRNYTFDAVYGADSAQEELYEENFRLDF